jgi:hypothetical protein
VLAAVEWSNIGVEGDQNGGRGNNEVRFTSKSVSLRDLALTSLAFLTLQFSACNQLTFRTTLDLQKQ